MTKSVSWHTDGKAADMLKEALLTWCLASSLKSSCAPQPSEHSTVRFLHLRRRGEGYSTAISTITECSKVRTYPCNLVPEAPVAVDVLGLQLLKAALMEMGATGAVGARRGPSCLSCATSRKPSQPSTVHSREDAMGAQLCHVLGDLARRHDLATVGAPRPLVRAVTHFVIADLLPLVLEPATLHVETCVKGFIVWLAL